MRYLQDRDGAIKPLLCIALLVISGYIGYQFAIPYYKYSAFKNETKEITRLGLGSVEKTRAEIYEAAKSFKIPIEEQDIKITPQTNNVRVQIAWSVVVDLFGQYQKTLNFKIDLEE